MATAPGAMHLRTLQTLAEVAVEKNSTLVLPIPTEIMDTFRLVNSRMQQAGAVLPERQTPAPAEP